MYFIDPNCTVVHICCFLVFINPENTWTENIVVVVRAGWVISSLWELLFAINMLRSGRNSSRLQVLKWTKWSGTCLHDCGGESGHCCRLLLYFIQWSRVCWWSNYVIGATLEPRSVFNPNLDSDKLFVVGARLWMATWRRELTGKEQRQKTRKLICCCRKDAISQSRHK